MDSPIFCSHDTHPPHVTTKIQEYDATLLMEKKGPFPFKLLVDQGAADKFLAGALAVGFRF